MEIELEKFPRPDPSIVLLVKLVVGDGAVFHTSPLEVTVSPPSSLTFPPLEAVFKVIFEIAEVVNIGAVLVGVFSVVEQLINVVITSKAISNLMFFIFFKN